MISLLINRHIFNSSGLDDFTNVLNLMFTLNSSVYEKQLLFQNEGENTKTQFNLFQTLKYHLHPFSSSVPSKISPDPDQNPKPVSRVWMLLLCRADVAYSEAKHSQESDGPFQTP